MDLRTWIEREGPGALTRLQNKTQLAYTTILRASQGEPIRRKTAELISAATGGEVSVASLLVGGEVVEATGTDGA